MEIAPLSCPTCGAPLRSVAPSATKCVYCGAVLRVHESPEERKARSQLVALILAEAYAQRLAPIDALRAAIDGYLGAPGAGDGAAQLALSLATDFEKQARVKILRHPAALARVAEASARAFGELRAVGRTRINLPYLAATIAGPVHLTRELTSHDLALMCS
jgi:hypothetical protein